MILYYLNKLIGEIPKDNPIEFQSLIATDYLLSKHIRNNLNRPFKHWWGRHILIRAMEHNWDRYYGT